MNFKPTSIPQSEYDDRAGLYVDPPLALDMRRLLSWLEGDLYESGMTDKGEMSTAWHCGVEMVSDYDRDQVVFYAGTDYGKHLIEAVFAHATPVELDPNTTFNGKYVMLALGAGLPETLVVLGPVSEGGVKIIQHPRVLKDLASVLTSPTNYHGFMKPDSFAPRLIGTFDNLEAFSGLTAFLTVKQALEEVAGPRLKTVSLDFIKALYGNTKIGDELISRATIRHESLVFRSRVAEGLLALNIA